MDTYTWFREFADSWWLLGMFLFFLGQILWTFRPGSRETHRNIANVVFRNDTLAAEGACDGTCPDCPAQRAADFLTPEEKTNE